MTGSTAVRRLALWKVALGPVAVAASLLAFAGAADAAVFNVSPGTNSTAGKDNLSNAITQANTAGGSNTIVLATGTYRPLSCTPAPCTPTAASVLPAVTSNLTITGDHSKQAAGTASTLIDGSGQASTAPGNLLTISGTGNLTLEALEIDSGGGTGASDISDGGSLTTWGVTISGSPGSALGVLAGASATLNESTIASPVQNAINSAGTLHLNGSTIGAGGAIAIANSSGTFFLHNTLLAYQTGVECNGGTDSSTNAMTTDGSLDDDGTCGVQHSNVTSVDTGFPGLMFNGGPTGTYEMPAGSATIGAGATPCPTTDQRFFVQTTSCDIGAVTNAATRDTTGPTCSVTGSSSGPPPTQTVTVADSGSGLGPESGTAYDPNSQTSPQPQNPRAAASVPSDAISGLGITNGTVAVSTLPTAPTRSSVTLTATKTTLGTLTHWWFTATDWAGNVTFCQ